MLWGVEVEPPQVLAIREQRNEAQRLRIGEGRGENPKISYKGVGWCEFRIMHYSLVQDAKFVVLSNGKNFGFLRVGNAG